MLSRIVSLCLATCFTLGLAAALSAPSPAEGTRPPVGANGVVRAQSAYPIGETVERIKKDIAAKGIVFFLEVDQTKLAKDAGIALRPSTLLIFGNPGLGTHFITAQAEAGLDWPVRLLITQDDQGRVWAVYTDFIWIAQRHGITTRDKEFTMANAVVASILSSVAAK